jgi:hypothetical protein
MSEFVLPPPLEPGDPVAVIAPAGGHGAAFPDVYALGLECLGSLGVEPVEFPTATMERPSPPTRSDWRPTSSGRSGTPPSAPWSPSLAETTGFESRASRRH